MIKVLLNDIKTVNEFVRITGGLMSEVDAISGRYVVNAKSIMGLLSLDISKPIEVNVREVIASEKIQFESLIRNLGWIVD